MGNHFLYMELFNKKNLEKIGKHLLKKNETIAVAESVTSGLLQFAFSNVPDAAHFFQGGITAYNIGQKYKHLQVEPVHALSVNCVSKKVASEMALHICKQYSSDWGIGITGYATAVPESGNKIFAYYAIAYKMKLKTSGRFSHKKENPPEVQRKYVDDIIRKFLQLI